MTPKTQDEYQAGLAERVAKRLGCTAASLGADVPLDSYGLDSLEAAHLSGEIESALGIRVEPTLLWDRRTLGQLAAFLATEPQEVAVAAPAATPPSDGDYRAYTYD